MSNEIQQDLQDDLTTIEPDLMNMTRLFSLPDSVWDAPEYHFAAAIEGGQYVIRFYGKTQTAQGVTDIPSDADARIQTLHRRRALRRLCRQTLYDLLRKETGIHPPWGSMTGIRPTHLMYEALNEGMSMADAQEHLVHQFDVAPEKAALLAELVSVQQQLPPPGDDWMDVYIGIPFCTTRCTYCSFSSGELGDGHLVAPYLTALFREMDACAQLLRDAGKKLRAVYVGGGTPTSLNEEQLPRLLEKMMQCFPCAMEYTVEAGRPDTLTLPKLEAIRRAGVQRISINPQTMNDKTLRVIGRAHTAQQVEEAYAMARTANIHHINMDVIAGLPGENIDDFTRTMDAALRLKPESLTVHTLAIKRSSRLHLENAPLPDGETASRMVQLGLDTAHQLGMKPYYLYRQKYMAGNQENVGYALPGHACQYNVDIMEETTHILALGAGGISKRVYPEEGHIGRAPNVSNIGSERSAMNMAQNPTFVITMTDGREMKGELYPETAPQSVGNFIALANSGFYDGLIFHRVIPGFMIQGGDPKGTGIGGPGYHIKGEFAMNGVNNPLKHTYGVLSMARSMMPDSAGSQFFIMTSDSPHLDGQYAAFGKVLEGMDVADAIVSVKRDMRDKPLEPQVMKSIRVETFGQTYPFEQM